MTLGYGTLVKVTKVTGLNDKTAAKGEWIQGQHNPGKSPEQGYYFTGRVVTAPMVGDRFVVARTKRLEVTMPGMFTSSQVTKVQDLASEGQKKLLVHTENSVYQVELL